MVIYGHLTADLLLQNLCHRLRFSEVWIQRYAFLVFANGYSANMLLSWLWL